jgi:hypothetical protein
MTHTICRIYSSPETARAAAEELLEFRQLAGAVHIVDAPDDPYGPIDDVVKNIMRHNVPREHAKVYAQGIQYGGALVATNAPLFSAELVAQCLDQYQPIPTGLKDPEPDRFYWDEAAPFSSALRLPLKYDDPTPFSNFWNLPVLKEDTTAQSEGLETIRFFSRKPGLFSGLFGWQLLSKSGSHPFSNFFGLPIFARGAAPFSKILNLPVISNFKSW